MYVYADNAATTKLSEAALAAMMPYFTDVFGNPSSLHSVGQEAKEHLEDARTQAMLKQLLSLSPPRVQLLPLLKT